MEKRSGTRIVHKQIVVFYHANCTDGFSAAWSAWKKFGSKAEYIATFHDDPLPEGLVGKEIYTLDMTFPEPITRKLIKTNKRVTSIDHHITSKKTTMLTHKYSYALHHSGAVLAWTYFHPSKKIPKFLLSVEDMDIWKLKIHGTKELYAYLDLFEYGFQVYSKLIKDFESPSKRKLVFAIGNVIHRYIEKLLERQINKSLRVVKLAGHIVYSANATGSFRSELGHKLADLNPAKIGMVWWEDNKGLVIGSLRSIGDADVAKIAQKYGGGGHKHSASFRIKSLNNIPWKAIE